jgi:hypothetical protein
LALHSSLTRSARQRQVTIPETITFGEPYDAIFKAVYMHQTHIAITEDMILVPISIDKNPLYWLLNNPESVRCILATGLKLPAHDSRTQNPEATSNLLAFNKYVWTRLVDRSNTPIRNYEDLIDKLSNLSNIDLAYITLSCVYVNEIGSSIFNEYSKWARWIEKLTGRS